LLLARDRLGVKPLYYAELPDRLLFASELKCLLASGLVPTDLDYEALDAYLSFGFVPGAATPLRAVRRLLPGELLSVEDGRVRRERYWRFPAPQPEPGRPAEQWSEELIALLDEAVRLRLMGEVPMGAMLSGGLDSSLVVALMARHTTGPVRTFSVGFREAGRANELADARKVAARYGCVHEELELSYGEQLVDLEELVWALDEPLADLSALGFLALSQLAARQVTVALSGQGADELFGGYQRHRTAALAEPFRRLPRPVRETAARALSGGRFGRVARVVAADGPVEQWIAAHERTEARAVRGPLLTFDGGRRAVERAGEELTHGGLSSLLYLDANLGLVDDMLHYFDRASMAHSLEVRVPFLDHQLVEWAARVPPRLKVHGRQTKVLLKQAARGLVPDEIIDKPKIGFFNGAADGWLRAQLSGGLSDYLLDPGARYTELLDQREVERLIVRQREGGDGGLLLAILMLEVWLSSFLPRATRPAAEPAEAVA
jgi:asparagine synthase (glutamine-hydrolysing)